MRRAGWWLWAFAVSWWLVGVGFVIGIDVAIQRWDAGPLRAVAAAGVLLVLSGALGRLEDRHRRRAARLRRYR